MTPRKTEQILRAISSITEDDYDFSEVPDSELESCLYYEYMRESEAIIREVENLRRQMVSKLKRRNVKISDLVQLELRGTKITNLPKTFETVMLLLLATARGFPALTWRKLSSSDKEELLGFSWKARRSEEKVWLKAFPPLVIETAKQNPSVGDSTLNAWIAKQREGYVTVSRPEAQKHLASAPKEFFLTGGPIAKFFEAGLFLINLNYDQDVLFDAFRDWLKAHRPEKGEMVRVERRGRRGWRDALNNLGALRLRYYWGTFGRVKRFLKPLKEKPNGMFYAHRESFNRACSAAVENFRTLLKLSEEHQPAHFKKAEQK